ncbi:CG14500 [Drosophila busckii]|uniref:CG14500 n=1 Tax=Drosophila busckii TaxID=30019 RepID=A0A0M5J308_DROBS|nr:ladderlectin [Drosophila busckii]ALC42281.1 CG14500 [Drosophila busckii]
MLWQKLIICVVLCLGLSLAQSNNDNSTSCAQHFSLVGDKCVLIIDRWNSWYEADRACRALGAGLLSLQNQQQKQQLEKWLNATAPYTTEFWTSGNCLGKQGEYWWQSTGQQARYLPWASKEPLKNAGDCISLFSNTTLQGQKVDELRLKMKDCTTWAACICEQTPQKFDTRICLKPAAFESISVPSN